MSDVNQDEIEIDLSDDVEDKQPPVETPPVEAPKQEEEEEEETPPTPPIEDPEKKEEELPPTPPVQEAEEKAPEPITKEDLRSMISEIRTEEYNSTKQFDAVYSDIESRYYPNGVSKVIVDSETGKPIRTAQDVIDLSGNPDLTIEEAERWRLQKQSEWDANVRDIENNIRKIAEQTIALERGTTNVLNKYAELFKANPELERRLFKQYQATITIDKEKGTVISAPVDIEDYYDTVLEPYRLAFEASKTVTPPAPVEAPKPPEPPKPSKEDRLDTFGDGGAGGDDDDDDPDDFEAQLRKEFKND